MNAFLSVGILLILAVLITGCMTTTPPQVSPPQVPEPPDLVGNWTGTMKGYVEGQGFTDYSGASMTMRVTEQEDRIFQGEFLFPRSSGTTMAVAFAGVIGRDGMTLTMVERTGGYTFGTLVAPDEIELIYTNDAEPFEVAIDSLKRS